MTWGRPRPLDNWLRVSRCHLEPVGLRCAEPGNNVDVGPRSRPRVLVFGGSSVRNPFDPDPEMWFATTVQALVPEAEVVNLGVPGLAAVGVAALVSQAPVLDPDVIVIYSGHNDFNQDVFAGRIAATRMWMLPVYAALSNSWLHSLLARRPVGQARQSFELGATRTLATDDDFSLRVRPEILARYQEDLRSALSASRVPVVLSTLMRNASWPPQGTLTTGHPGCAAFLEHANLNQPQSLVEGAEAACGDEALTWWARMHHAITHHDDAAAAAAWGKSLDRDPLPMRAPLIADDTIRELAAAEDAILVDLSLGLGLMPSGRYFRDTLHLSADGGRAVGAQMAPAVREALTRSAALR